MEFSNRYFSAAVLDAHDRLDFSLEVDPHGILATQGVDAIHTSDNTVLYFERVTDRANQYVCSYNNDPSLTPCIGRMPTSHASL